MAKVKKDIKAVKIKQGPGSLAWLFSFFGAALFIFLLAAGDDHFERQRTGQLYQEIKDSVASETTIRDLKEDVRYQTFFQDMDWKNRSSLNRIETTINDISKDPKKIQWKKINKRILDSSFPKLENSEDLQKAAFQLNEETNRSREYQKRKTKLTLKSKNISRNYEEILDDVSEMFLSGRNINPDTYLDPLKDEITVFNSGGLQGVPVIPGVPENLEGEEMLSRFLRSSFVPRFEEIASYAQSRTKMLQTDVAKLREDLKNLEEERKLSEVIITELKATISEELRKGVLTFVKPIYSNQSEWLRDTTVGVSKNVNAKLSSL